MERNVYICTQQYKEFALGARDKASSLFTFERAPSSSPSAFPFVEQKMTFGDVIGCQRYLDNLLIQIGNTHPGRKKTLAVARKRYYWPTLRIAVETHVAWCVTCAQHKGAVKGKVPMLQYPLSEKPWDIVSIDLLQLPQTQYGSRYLPLCVDHLTR